MFHGFVPLGRAQRDCAADWLAQRKIVFGRWLIDTAPRIVRDSCLRVRDISVALLKERLFIQPSARLVA